MRNVNDRRIKSPVASISTDKPSDGISVRVAACEAVERIFTGGAFSNLILTGTITKMKLTTKDKALFTALVYGTVERMRTLRWILSRYSRTIPHRKAEAVLCTGIYQILYMEKIPDNAACNETVKVAKELLSLKEAGFVNAVLRNVCRDREALLAEIESLPDGIRYSVSDSVCKLVRKQYPDDYEKIFSSFFDRGMLPLRINSLKISSDSLQKRLTAKGISFELTCDGIIVVTGGADKALEMLSEGLFFVQGVASQRAVRALGAKSGMTVIDVCACPGGKTLSAAIDMQNTGKVVSLDLHENKLGLIEKSASALGINIIVTGNRDARTPAPEYTASADRVICDVPCTSIGVIGSKPEIRYKEIEDISNLIRTQSDILRASATYVKSGGVLVYSTCSINKRENEEIVNGFLASDDSFTLTDSITTKPCEEYCDGFYMARLVKS